MVVERWTSTLFGLSVRKETTHVRFLGPFMGGKALEIIKRRRLIQRMPGAIQAALLDINPGTGRL